MSRVAGKVCVVTGAGSGIGRALALELAARGARGLAISDVNADGLAETARMLRDGAPVEVHEQTLDVSDREAMEAYAQAVAGHFGVVHQIYNNAGIAFSRLVEESTYEDYERVFGVNLWGVIHGTKAFLPHVIASGDGHVINISSLNGILAQNKMSHYCATKFAVRGFTETLRLEMATAGHRVGVTVVHPGGVRTAIADHAMEDARRRGLEVTEADERRRRLYNEKILRMSPAKAAKIIVGGVERDKARVIVGGDARFVDLLVRLAPSVAPRLIAAIDKRMG